MRQEWSSEELLANWTLVCGGRDLVASKSGATRLGFGLVLRFFELEGRFPDVLEEVPPAAVECRARKIEPPGRTRVEKGLVAARGTWEKTFCARTIGRLGEVGTARLLSLVAEDNEMGTALSAALKRDPGAVGLGGRTDHPARGAVLLTSGGDHRRPGGPAGRLGSQDQRPCRAAGGEAAHCRAEEDPRQGGAGRSARTDLARGRSPGPVPDERAGSFRSCGRGRCGAGRSPRRRGSPRG